MIVGRKDLINRCSKFLEGRRKLEMGKKVCRAATSTIPAVSPSSPVLAVRQLDYTLLYTYLSVTYLSRNDRLACKAASMIPVSQR